MKTLAQLGIKPEDTIRLQRLTYPEHGSHAAMLPGDYVAKDFPLYILNLEPKPYIVIQTKVQAAAPKPSIQNKDTN